MYRENKTRNTGCQVVVTSPQDSSSRDEQPALLSRPAFGRTLSHGVDLAGRSLVDLFVGSSTVTDRKEPAHFTASESRKAGLFANPQDRNKTGRSPHNTLRQKRAKRVCLSINEKKIGKSNHNKSSVPIFRSRVLHLTVSYEYRHEVGAAGASPPDFAAILAFPSWAEAPRLRRLQQTVSQSQPQRI